MILSLETQRIERLVGLCRLWGAVKYFHPYLAYRQDIDWDAALVAAIPLVNAAGDAVEYAAAVQSMLAVLCDPATRVVQANPHDLVPHELQPSFSFSPDGILTATVNYYEDLNDFFGAYEKMMAIKNEIPKARGVLFDFRSKTPLAVEDFMNLTYVFQWSRMASMLTTVPLSTPGMRVRMHIGLKPQGGTTSGGYTSAFRVIDGNWIEPAPEAREIPIIFLINAWSELPPEALALQGASKAIIVMEGEPSQAPVMDMHLERLSDEVTAAVRLNEVVFQDGSGGFAPDLVLPAGREDDPALTAALKLLQDFTPRLATRASLPAHGSPKVESAYSDWAFPPLEYRVLAVFRIWTAIHNFFPYKDLMGEDWDGVLREFIRRMEQAGSALEYHLAVAEMVTHIHDSHGFMTSPVYNEYFGEACPPVRIQMVENLPVITVLQDEEVTKTAGVNCGDVLLKIDGQNAMDQIAKCAKYTAASTPQSLMYRAANLSLKGPNGSSILLTLRDREGYVKDVSLLREAEYENHNLYGRSGEAIRLISEDIGYADLIRLEIPQVNEMFECFKYTKGIIFDMRGYPRGTAWPIGARLASRNGIEAALFQCPLLLNPSGESGEKSSLSNVNSFMQVLPTTDQWRYPGNTVMLIDERAMSQSEHSGLFFEAANGTRFIGSPTAGANGDVTNICVPGGIWVMFTGQGVRHADGRQLQRIGLVPDVESRPTLRGIQNGIDEVLEAAIQYLQREFEDL